MALKINDIVSKNLYRTLTIIEDEPDYDLLDEPTQALYVNAITLAMMLGVDRHDHISLVMKLMLYTMLSGMVHAALADPEAPSVLPRMVTVVVQQQA